MKTLTELKQQGRTVVVITHRSNVLAISEKILLLGEGQIAVYGDRDKVMAVLKDAGKLVARPAAAPAPVAAQAGSGAS